MQKRKKIDERKKKNEHRIFLRYNKQKVFAKYMYLIYV